MSFPGTFDIVVTAADQGQPPLATQISIQVVVMTTTDAASYPFFDLPTYTLNVLEESTVPLMMVDLGASIGAGNEDDGVYYNITLGLILDYFSIEATSVSTSMPHVNSIVQNHTC